MTMQLVESFSWTTDINQFATRYNAAGLFNSCGIGVGEGRFPPGDALRCFGGFSLGLHTSLSTFVVGAAMQADVWPSTNPALFFQLNNLVTNVTHDYLEPDGTGRLRLKRGDGTILATGTTILLSGSYYYVELELVVDSVAGSAKLWVDGVLQFSIAGVNTQQGASNLVTHIRMTGFNSGLSRFSDMYVKDTTGNLGERRVLLLTPNGDGTYSEFTPSAAAPHFSLINLIPPTGDASYVGSNTPGQRDTYTFTDLPFNPAQINALQLSLYARKTDAGARKLATFVRSGGVDNPGVDQPITSTYEDFWLQIYETNPTTAAPWTFAGVNAAEFGVELTA